MSSSNFCSLSYSDSTAILCPRSVCLMVKMCKFFLPGQTAECHQYCQSHSRYQRTVKSPAPCCDFMSFGEMVRSAHQISAELAEQYRRDILEGPPRLAVSVSYSTFNFPTAHSFSVESCGGFAFGFAWLGIASFLFHEHSLKSHISSHILKACIPKTEFVKCCEKSTRL